MKLTLLLIVSALTCQLANAQMNAPDHPSERPVGNADMVLQPGKHKLEILPGSRAVRQAQGPHKITAANHSDPITKEKPAVAYSYATGDHVMLSGEVSFKLKRGASVAIVGPLAAGAKLVVPPDVYMLAASTPNELVNLVNQLQASSAVEWVEPFTLPGKVK